MGGSYGRGAMVCRTGKTSKDRGALRQCIALEGGSVGFQIGGQATDLVLLVMNERGASSILSSKVKLGADASVAAGPVGRDASADTDAYLRSEVLSYSRSRGLFAGISLEGSTLRPDDDATADVYGRKLTAREIVLGGKVGVPDVRPPPRRRAAEECPPESFQRIGRQLAVLGWPGMGGRKQRAPHSGRGGPKRRKRSPPAPLGSGTLRFLCP